MISVIVPVYNVENYIRECLDSILAQTFIDFELILVNDGSTDHSGRICEEYKEKDSRIKVFHKENGGLSSARNKGIEEAKGEFICFVDSDDTIRGDYLEILYNTISADGSDLAICDIDAPRLSGAELCQKHHVKISSEEARKWLYDDRTREYVLMVVAWNKMYSAKIFKNIRYPNGRLHEDEFLIGPVLYKCDYISFTPEELYFYRENEAGITSDAKKMDVRHLDAVDALSERVELAISQGDKEFALVTLKNSLYKCARFYREAGELSSRKMKKASRDKYKEVYFRYNNILGLKQKLKYALFFGFPRRFIKIYNP